MLTDLLRISCSPSLDMNCLELEEGSKGLEIDDGGTAPTAGLAVGLYFTLLLRDLLNISLIFTDSILEKKKKVKKDFKI